MTELRHDVENPKMWDYDSAEKRTAARRSALVASVEFTSQEFNEVASAAEATGVGFVEIIRNAAIEKASRTGKRRKAV